MSTKLNPSSFLVGINFQTSLKSLLLGWLFVAGRQEVAQTAEGKALIPSVVEKFWIHQGRRMWKTFTPSEAVADSFDVDGPTAVLADNCR